MQDAEVIVSDVEWDSLTNDEQGVWIEYWSEEDNDNDS